MLAQAHFMPGTILLTTPGFSLTAILPLTPEPGSGNNGLSATLSDTHATLSTVVG
jgi:hypothetical protein